MVISQVIKNITKQCLDDRCPQIAAALAYVTLLALIPLTLLSYKIYSTAFSNLSWYLKAQEFVFNSLSPTTVEQVKQYLINSTNQAGGITIIGFLMLFISMVFMMHTIDSALNSIWKISKPSNLVRRLLVYSALLIFGPLAISFSIFVSTYLASLPLIIAFSGNTFDSGFFKWLPFFIIWIAFMTLYKWVPDCEVKWLHAFLGGSIAACLFEIAKNIFTLLVSYFPTYKLLYGALAAIPLLLIWIYLTWLIVLIGAEITHYMNKRLLS